MRNFRAMLLLFVIGLACFGYSCKNEWGDISPGFDPDMENTTGNSQHQVNQVKLPSIENYYYYSDSLMTETINYVNFMTEEFNYPCTYFNVSPNWWKQSFELYLWVKNRDNYPQFELEWQKFSVVFDSAHNGQHAMIDNEFLQNTIEVLTYKMSAAPSLYDLKSYMDPYIETLVEDIHESEEYNIQTKDLVLSAIMVYYSQIKLFDLYKDCLVWDWPDLNCMVSTVSGYMAGSLAGYGAALGAIALLGTGGVGVAVIAVAVVVVGAASGAGTGAVAGGCFDGEPEWNDPTPSDEYIKALEQLNEWKNEHQ